MNWPSIKKLVITLVLFATRITYAEEVRVATASNFVSTLEQLARVYEQKTGHKIVCISGSSGKLSIQILNEAPFDIFLSADQKTVDAIVSKYSDLKNQRFIYGHGRLAVVYRLKRIQGTEILKHDFLRTSKHIAIANPKSAPYGAATEAFLRKMNIWTDVDNHIVLGENIAQTLQFIQSGGADIGFVSWAQAKLIQDSNLRVLEIPYQANHQLAHEAVLLPRGLKNNAAKDFFAFLKSKAAQRIIQEAGYD